MRALTDWKRITDEKCLEAMQLADAFDSEGIANKDIENIPYQWLGYSLLLIVLTSGVGIALFRKKEIR